MYFNCIAKLAEKEENAKAKKSKISNLSEYLSAKASFFFLRFSAEPWISELQLVRGVGSGGKA